MKFKRNVCEVYLLDNVKFLVPGQGSNNSNICVDEGWIVHVCHDSDLLYNVWLPVYNTVTALANDTPVLEQEFKLQVKRL